jgi:hypothetical protein
MSPVFEFDERLHGMLQKVKAEVDRDKKRELVILAINYLKSKNQHLAYISELLDSEGV